MQIGISSVQPQRHTRDSAVANCPPFIWTTGDPLQKAPSTTEDPLETPLLRAVLLSSGHRDPYQKAPSQRIQPEPLISCQSANLHDNRLEITGCTLLLK
ncbi:hypothetical protein CEXT_750821 [Caerostris extrusa]|uniref:Uncharacterized protein n=1 Tax=Caerostris extrusa TaxID=172846 RepID=A0AAV4NZX6_CAEEX|nr:hypothetical protein CEXT_750821 [Caerostris extrusa]